MKNVIIAAGGTGGHINAAISLGEAVESQYNVIYFSGKRHLDYKLFTDKNVLHIDAKPLRTKNPLKLLINIFLNIITFIKIFFEIININPVFVIGCGGYVCGPTLLAAWLSFKKIFVVEQNAIAGLTNKLLAKISDKNFVAFQNTKGINKNFTVSGNPIRSNIKFSEIKIPKEKINVLVFGGSLGATQINEIILKYAKERPEKINIRHQVGKGNINKIDLDGYEQFEYLDNINEDYAWANIIVSRAGASSVSELAVVQKPVIFIPYPNAVDNHQEYNARSMQANSHFSIHILNQKLSKEELYSEFLSAINDILSNEKYLPSKVKEHKNSNELIIREIKKICME